MVEFGQLRGDLIYAMLKRKVDMTAVEMHYFLNKVVGGLGWVHPLDMLSVLDLCMKDYICLGKGP